nr:hypothetical protein [Haloplanus rubicundus]
MRREECEVLLGGGDRLLVVSSRNGDGDVTGISERGGVGAVVFVCDLSGEVGCTRKQLCPEVGEPVTHLWANTGELNGVDASLARTSESDRRLLEVDVEDILVDLLRDGVGIALVVPPEDGLGFCFEPTVPTREIGFSGGFEALRFLLEVRVSECLELLAVLIQLRLGVGGEQRLLLVEIVGDLLLEDAVVVDGRVAIGFIGLISEDSCPEFTGDVEIIGLSVWLKPVGLPDCAATSTLHLIVGIEILDEPATLTAPTADDRVSRVGVGASIALGGTSRVVVHQIANADLAR